MNGLVACGGSDGGGGNELGDDPATANASGILVDYPSEWTSGDNDYGQLTIVPDGGQHSSVYFVLDDEAGVPDLYDGTESALSCDWAEYSQDEGWPSSWGKCVWEKGSIKNFDGAEYREIEAGESKIQFFRTIWGDEIVACGYYPIVHGGENEDDYEPPSLCVFAVPEKYEEYESIFNAMLESMRSTS